MTTTVDVTPAAVAVRGTYIDAVAVDELFVDHSYQRPLDTARARKLARTWDRRLAGVIEVSVGTGFFSVTVALADFAVFAWLVAVTVTLPRPTILFGAV